MKFSTTAICLAASLLSPVQALKKSKGGESACFNKQGNSYKEYSDKIYAVSPTKECGKDATECGADSQNVQISENRTLNVTTDKEDEVFDAISKATGLNFDESVDEETGEGVSCSIGIDSGDKIYVGYSPGFECVNGTMGDCVEGVKEGLPVKACYPIKTEEDGEPVALLQCLVANSTNTPDVKFKAVEGSAAGLTVDIKLLSLFSFLAVGSFWVLPSL